MSYVPTCFVFLKGITYTRAVHVLVCYVPSYITCLCALCALVPNVPYLPYVTLQTLRIMRALKGVETPQRIFVYG